MQEARHTGSMLFSLLQICLGLVFLYIGSEALVRGSVGAAVRLGISRIVIGLTLVAFATSSPELVVGLQAAWTGEGDLALGNMIGSNICNIALIVGTAAVLCPIRISRQVIRKETPAVLIASLGAALLMADGRLSRLDGFLLAAGFVLYNVLLIRAARREQAQPAEALPEETASRTPAFYFMLVVIGLCVLVLGSNFLIRGSVSLARLFHVPETVIGLTLLALGTSLPELAAAVTASLRKEPDLVVGNVIGSNLFNILCVLGLAAMIRPMATGSLSLLDYSFFLGTAVLLFPLMRSGFKISRREGGFLLAAYAVYVFLLAGIFL